MRIMKLGPLAPNWLLTVKMTAYVHYLGYTEQSN